MKNKHGSNWAESAYPNREKACKDSAYEEYRSLQCADWQHFNAKFSHLSEYPDLELALKSRELSLENPESLEVLEFASFVLEKLPGVEKVEIQNACKFVIDYNRNIIDENQIEQLATEIQSAFGARWFERLREHLNKL